MYRSCFLIILFFSISTIAQQPVFKWARQFGSSVIDDTYNDNGRSIAVDQQGNVYSAGLFFNVVDFDPGPGVFNLTASCISCGSIYISKLDSAGEFEWAKQIPTQPSGPITLTLDQNANIYLSSYFGGAVDFDPGPGVNSVTSIGQQDAFILKLDQAGNFGWIKQFGGAGSGNAAAGYSLDVDQNNNVVLCGSFYGTIDFDPGPNNFNLNGIGTSEVFIAKLTATGNFIWAKKLGNFTSVFHSVSAQDLNCDVQGNIYTTGNFNGVCDLDPGVNSFYLTSGGPSDGFICKLDANGNFLWAKQIGNSSGNNVIQPTGIEIDAQNYVYTTGSFIGTQDVDPGINVYNLTSNGSFDSYILKINAQGNFIWAKNLGGNSVDYSFDVAVDNNNDLYTIGIFSGVSDFDPGPAVFLLDLYDDAVLTKFDANGNFIYAAPFKRIADGLSAGRRLATDLLQNVYITGYFGGTVDFDPGPAVYALDEGRGWIDAFVLKLSKCTNITTATLTINSCDNYVLNNHVYDTSGTYIQTIPNTSGCDSIITLHLIINKKFTLQTITICDGESFYAGGANQTSAGVFKDTLQTSLGCDSIITTNLFVNPKPAPYLGQDKDLCVNSQLTITPGAFQSYVWQDMSTQNNFTVTTAGLYWVTVMNNYNCSATDSVLVNTVPLPSNFLKEKDSICSYDKLTLKPLVNYNSYSWSTGATQSNITISAPGQYWLRATDASGCTGTDTITIYPKQCMIGVYIPTAFTPNGDGKNDSFKAIVFGKLKSFKLRVFDRSGTLIFETIDPDHEWNGLYKGVSFTTATFVWYCTYQLEDQKQGYQKGTVTLIR